jgi:hypothetical protein
MASDTCQQELSHQGEVVKARKIYIPLLLAVNKTVSGMKYCDIVHVLDVALLEMSVDAELLPQEVQRIKSLGLRFGDRWDLRVSWKLAEAHEITPPILERNSLWFGLSGRVVKQQRTLCVLLLGVLLKPGLVVVSAMNGLMWTYSILIQSGILTLPYPMAG